jgi:hypothetical protein
MGGWGDRFGVRIYEVLITPKTDGGGWWMANGSSLSPVTTRGPPRHHPDYPLPPLLQDWACEACNQIPHKGIARPQFGGHPLPFSQPIDTTPDATAAPAEAPAAPAPAPAPAAASRRSSRRAAAPAPSLAPCPPPLLSAPVWIDATPLKSTRVLEMAWFSPPLKPHSATKPADYVSTILGHEGSSSLLSQLKAMGLATGLYAGVEEDGDTSAATQVREGGIPGGGLGKGIGKQGSLPTVKEGSLTSWTRCTRRSPHTAPTTTPHPMTLHTLTPSRPPSGICHH